MLKNRRMSKTFNFELGAKPYTRNTKREVTKTVTIAAGIILLATTITALTAQYLPAGFTTYGTLVGLALASIYTYDSIERIYTTEKVDNKMLRERPFSELLSTKNLLPVSEWLTRKEIYNSTAANMTSTNRIIEARSLSLFHAIKEQVNTPNPGTSIEWSEQLYEKNADGKIKPTENIYTVRIARNNDKTVTVSVEN